MRVSFICYREEMKNKNKKRSLSFFMTFHIPYKVRHNQIMTDSEETKKKKRPQMNKNGVINIRCDHSMCDPCESPISFILNVCVCVVCSLRN